MGIKLGDVFPNFSAETNGGPIKFHDWIGDSCKYSAYEMEILRVVDSLQLTLKNKVATPTDWQPGDACMVVPTLSKEAKVMFPEHEVKPMPSGKEYM
ncbi:unnamed protein product [Cyprideis torosa]|uniref:Uncharacterized protein n=1 Tax=Cyprideis torosa TaxID=163714 RepID=A0A7R8ZPV5_9CRUS|nr:unnamed protein product [Cyprideis torosa]CAG0901472.1 unnamed protein product [Cyprideis torosa]